MDWVLATINIIPILLFVLIGWVIKYKKAYWMISGYNTMSAEKKKNVDTEGLGRLISGMCFTMAGLFLVSLVLGAAHMASWSVYPYLLILPVVTYTIIRAQKYDGNTRNREGRMKTGTKVLIGSVVVILGLLTFWMGSMFYSGSKASGFTLQNGLFRISGIYGLEIPVYEISELELKPAIPEVLMRTNGSAIGSQLKGHFRLKDAGAATLFTDVSKPPFIYIRWNSSIYYLNSGDSQKTEELFSALNEEWKKALKK